MRFVERKVGRKPAYEPIDLPQAGTLARATRGLKAATTYLQRLARELGMPCDSAEQANALAARLAHERVDVRLVDALEKYQAALSRLTAQPAPVIEHQRARVRP